LAESVLTPERKSSIDEISDEQLERTFRTNIFGYFFMARAAIPYLEKGSAIVNTGSITGMQGSKELLDYSATKGAIHAFTKTLAQQLLDRGIRVNSVAPGPVWTPLNPADEGRSAKEVSEFGGETPMECSMASDEAVACVGGQRPQNRLVATGPNSIARPTRNRSKPRTTTRLM
jgi:NAD(P)-dependent dehydrogenase (short-subunit alcohol dehydrogenase family)